jgi:hypothetical protein
MTTTHEALFGSAIHVFIERLGTDMFDESWRSFNCAEIDSITEVMRLGGAFIGEEVEGERAARMVLAQHYGGDEHGDRHFMGVGQRVRWHTLDREFFGTVEEDDGSGIIAVRWDAAGAWPEGVDTIHVADLEAVYPEEVA